jgi:hypothetical protein
MRNAIPSFIAISALAAACGGEDNPVLIDAPDIDAPTQQDAPVDAAPQVDFSCMGNAAPADGTAIDPLTISGSTVDFDLLTQSLVAVSNATVNAFDAGGSTPTGTDTTDAGGAWDLSLASGTNPIDGFVEATKAGSRTVRLYPPSPLTTALTNVPLILMTNSNFGFVLMFAGATQSAANGTVGLVVTDCANNPIDGAVPSVTQNGTAVGTMVDGSAVQPGLFFFFDVPPGVTTVGATFNGMTLRAHDIDVVAQVTSSTGVRPGF